MVKKDIYSGPVYLEGKNNMLLLQGVEGVREIYSSPMYHEGCQDFVYGLGGVALVCKTDNCLVGDGKRLRVILEGDDLDEVSEVEGICLDILPGKYCKAHAVVGIVNYNGNILLGKKRADKPGFLSGEWHIPGETLEEGETDQRGLKRGVMEEAGIEIRILDYLASHRTPKHNLAKWYECEALTYDIKPGSDLSEVLWVPKREVLDLCSEKAQILWPEKIKDYFK